MFYDILNNTQWYKPVPMEVISQSTNEFKVLISIANLDALMDKDTCNYLNVQFPQELTFFSTPKIQKNHMALPGRPIILGIGSITENASRMVHFFLLPQSPSFLLMLEKPWICSNRWMDCLCPRHPASSSGLYALY